jgi:hypothetical protein
METESNPIPELAAYVAATRPTTEVINRFVDALYTGLYRSHNFVEVVETDHPSDEDGKAWEIGGYLLYSAVLTIPNFRLGETEPLKIDGYRLDKEYRNNGDRETPPDSDFKELGTGYRTAFMAIQAMVLDSAADTVSDVSESFFGAT